MDDGFIPPVHRTETQGSIPAGDTRPSHCQDSKAQKPHQPRNLRPIKTDSSVHPLLLPAESSVCDCHCVSS